GIGLKFGTFPLIANYAKRLWQQMGKTSKSCETLITQLQIYKKQKKFINGISNPYTVPYTISNDTLLMWYNTCKVNPNHLQHLAIKLFPITPRQLYYTQATEITPEIIINIAETVFKEFEEKEISEDNDDIEMLNSAENLYSNKQDLDLSISTFINLESSVFTSSKNNHESEDFDETKSDNNIQDKYNVDEIIAMQLELEYDSH
ncbi:17355_t:CDS:2, partial [Gigaspora margarita]